MSSEQRPGQLLIPTRPILLISMFTAILLFFSCWGYVLFVEGIEWTQLFSQKNLGYVKEFVGFLLGDGNEHPAFYQGEAWKEALGLAWRTLKMSLLAIGFAGGGMLFTVLPGARITADGKLTLTATVWGRMMFGIIRIIYIFSRAVPELFWAMFIVFIFKPGILPGALALGIHNFGILGKLCSEVVEDLDLRPARSLRNSGAGIYQVLFYGILPEVTPQFLTYVLYRWEDIIRATIVVGFVASGGLGLQFRKAMSWFHYTDVTLLLTVYFLLVMSVDLISGSLRWLAKQ